MNKMIKNSMILMAITLAAGLLLGFVYEATKDPIAEQQAKAQEEAYRKVFPDAEKFELLYGTEEVPAEATAVLTKAGLEGDAVKEAYRAVGADGNVLGIVMNISSSEGYGGDIKFAMGIQKDGTVNGISILSISETAGLGMKAAQESFYGQFAGKKVDSFTYTKTGASGAEEIDAISGATITTNAVTNGVNAGIYFFNAVLKGGLLDE